MMRRIFSIGLLLLFSLFVPLGPAQSQAVFPDDCSGTPEPNKYRCIKPIETEWEYLIEPWVSGGPLLGPFTSESEAVAAGYAYLNPPPTNWCSVTFNSITRNRLPSRYEYGILVGEFGAAIYDTTTYLDDWPTPCLRQGQTRQEMQRWRTLVAA